tara:strand:+ start:278 stop:469 length:192 start_codon:yes stop_codon:yes gene_type:complete
MARELYKLRDKIKEIKIYCEQVQSENLALFEDFLEGKLNAKNGIKYKTNLELTTEILRLLEEE